MMSQHLTSMFEQIGNFTKNNLSHNSKLKDKENKSNSNHVGGEREKGDKGERQASPSHKIAHAQPPPPLKKPCKLRNVSSKAESYDSLYGNSSLVSLALIHLDFLSLQVYLQLLRLFNNLAKLKQSA